MKVKNLMGPGGRIFLKSEWEPINKDWPCLSFSQSRAEDRLRNDFRRDCDVIVFVGTGKEPTASEHRKCLLSVAVIDSHKILETEKMLSSEKLNETKKDHGYLRWEKSVAIVRAAEFISKPLPSAGKLVPKTYPTIGRGQNSGNIVPLIEENERKNIEELEVREFSLNYSKQAQNYLEGMGIVLASNINVMRSSRASSAGINSEIERMANAICDRVSNSGIESTRTNPARTAPDKDELKSLLRQKWEHGDGRCALCEGKLAWEEGRNPLLQPSTDRIDSENGDYSEDNIQITHLACNLAKNQYSEIQFKAWLAIVRGK